LNLKVYVGYNTTQTGLISVELDEKINLSTLEEEEILDLVWENYPQLAAELAKVMFFELERDTDTTGKLLIYLNDQLITRSNIVHFDERNTNREVEEYYWNDANFMYDCITLEIDHINYEFNIP
ncbi:MAG: hypothetical protein ACRDBG_16075, partial [Waterburya sp.]